MVMMMRRPLFAGFGLSNEPVVDSSSLSVNKGRRHVDEDQIRANQPKASSRPGLGRSATVAGSRAPRRPFTSSGSTEADSTSNRHSVLRVADSRILEEGTNGGRATTSNGVPSAKNLVEAILGEPITGEPIFGGHRVRNRNGFAASTVQDQRSNNMGNQQSPLPLQRTEPSPERKILPDSVPFEIPFEETREQFPAVASLAAVIEMDTPAANSNANGNTTGLTRSRSKWNPFSRSRSKSAKPTNTTDRRRSRIQMTNLQKSPYIARSVTDLDRVASPLTTHSFTHIGPASPCWSTTNSTVEEKEEEHVFVQNSTASPVQVAPILNIDIPSYQMDRFSVMFGDLLERGSTPPMQDECEGKFAKFESANLVGFLNNDNDEMPPLARRTTTPLPRSCSLAALSPPPSRDSKRADHTLGAPVLLRSNTMPVENGARTGVQEKAQAPSNGLSRGMSRRLVSKFNRQEHIADSTAEPPHPIRSLSLLYHNDSNDTDHNNPKKKNSDDDIQIKNDAAIRPTLLPAAKIEDFPLRPSLDEQSLRTRPSTDFDDDDDDDDNDHEDGDDSKSIHENVQIFIARQVSVSRRPQRLVIPVNKLPAMGPASPNATTPTESTMLDTPMTPKVVHLSSPRLSAYRRSTLMAVSEV